MDAGDDNGRCALVRDALADELPVFSGVQRAKDAVVVRAGVDAPGVVRIDGDALDAAALQKQRRVCLVVRADVDARDGGETWEDRKPGSQHDSHAIATHPVDPARIYEAAGGGVAASTDRGDTWFPVDQGMDRHYSWGLAVDPADPDLWYVSASFSASYAHRSNGDARAILYRKRGDAPWQALNGTLPQPLPYMPYALLTLRDRPGVLVVGMQHGAIMLSEDEGDAWRTLDVQLPGLLALSEAAG